MLCDSQPGIVKDNNNFWSSQAIYPLPSVPLGQRHFDLYSQSFSSKTRSQTAKVCATTPCSNVGAQSFAKQNKSNIAISFMSQVKPPCYVQDRCKMTSLETQHFFSHALPMQQQQFHYSHSKSLLSRIATKPVSSVDRSKLVGGGGKRLSSKQSPWRQVDAQLSERGLCRVSVPTDGNCQFHAVVLHTTYSHVQMRQMVVQFLLDNFEHYSGFFTDDDDIQEYVSNLSQLRLTTWGDNLSLQLCADVLDRPIHVMQRHGVQVISPVTAVNNAIPIWVAYNGSTHYEGVRATTRRSNIPVNSATAPCNVVQKAQEQSDVGSNTDNPKIGNYSTVHEDGTKIKSTTWTLMSSNVTSFLSQHDSLFELEADIFAIQESRHTARSLHTLDAIVSKAGYSAVWGKPQPFRYCSRNRSTSGFNGRPGGVALFARKHMNLQAVPVGDSKVRQRLYESGRWTHGIIPFGNGRQVLHCMSIYGFAGAGGSLAIAEKNETFLTDVVLSIQELGNEAPLFLFGDFNIDVSSSEVLSHATSGELLYDLGSDLGPTFLPSHGKPRRLDAILSTKAATSTVQGIHLLDSTGLPGHFPVSMNVNISPFTDHILRIRRPAMFPQHIAFNEACLQHVLEKFPEPTDSTVDSLYNHFSKCAELYLSLASGFTTGKYLGRGQVPKLVKEQRFCPQAPQGRGCESVPVRRAKRILRRCEQLQYYLSHQDLCQVPQLWKRISSQSHFLFNFTSISLVSYTLVPELGELADIIQILRNAIDAAQKATVSKIVQAAGEKIQQS